MRIAIHEAKARLSDLVRRAEAGEAVELTRYGRTVARLVPPTPLPRTPLIGALRGRIRIGDDFDAPLPGLAEALDAPVEPR